MNNLNQESQTMVQAPSHYRDRYSGVQSIIFLHCDSDSEIASPIVRSSFLKLKCLNDPQEGNKNCFYFLTKGYDLSSGSFLFGSVFKRNK